MRRIVGGCGRSYTRRVATTVRDALTGVTVGRRYRVLARISRGGMATVYRALDTRLDREIALKVMHPHLADSPQFLARFQAEARAAARLAHPCIVTVLDTGIDLAVDPAAGPDDEPLGAVPGDGDVGGTAWLVMELLPGRTIRDELSQRGRFTLAETGAVMECLLSGLGAAHDAGIIHRDIKPENILATGASPTGPHPAYKVSDFGLARALGGNGSLTQTVLGTPAFLAPELARDGRIDARVDVYSAGVVLFELLTGRQPFTAESPVQVILAHINQDVPPVSQAIGPVFGDATAEIDSLVAWACARDPQVRPVHPHDLLDEMRRVFNEVPPAARHSRADLTPALPAGSRVTGSGPGGRSAAGDDTGGAGTGAGGGAGTSDDVNATRWFDTLRPAGAAAAADPGQTQALDLSPLRHTTQSPGPPESLTEVLPDHPHRPGAGSRRFVVREGATRRWGEHGLGVALFLAMITALGVAGWVWWSQVGPGSYTETPPVVGLDVATATQLLETAGFSATTEEVFDDVAVEGTVLTSRPGPGERVREGGEVVLAVSQGPELIEVPVVVGLTRDEATEAVAATELPEPTLGEVFDETVEVGRVVSVDPPAGEAVSRDTVIAISVSAGPAPRDVPNVVGDPRSDAEAALSAAGLVVGDVVEQYDPAIEAGVVVSQNPDAGTVERGAAVDLVVSLGPQPIPVPDVRNLTSGEAISVLEGAGFVVERQGSQILDRVFAQAPEAGAEQPPGAVIVITTF